MGMIATGKSNKLIAIELNLSQKTVEGHRTKIMRKLQVDSVADLVRIALMSEMDQGNP